VTLEAAKQAGLVGRRRVLDSTPLYDAVATMDTVTLVRSAIRGLLKVCDDQLQEQLRALLCRDDDYAGAGKPVCDYEDPVARQELIDALARDALALLAALDGRELGVGLTQAAALLATVVGQDLDPDNEGIFRIARRVTPDRVISTVDPETRHGRKTSARGFDGYKGHVAIDPDSELVTATAVSAGNVGDAGSAADLLAADRPAADAQADDPGAELTAGGDGGGGPLTVYGDAAYGTGELLADLEAAGADSRCKVQPPTAAGGRFTKDAFTIDLTKREVTCPAGQTTPLRRAKPGAMAYFGPACATCPLAAQCTSAKGGRTIYVGPYEQQLADARARQSDPDWVADYKATRPKVERKIGHLMRRRHGGRRARVRGKTKLAADFALLAAAVNLARLAMLAVACTPGRGWTTVAE
jgi:DDE family transposase